MLYVFIFLIIAAVSGIIFVVFKYVGFEFLSKFKKLTLRKKKKEDYWINKIKSNPKNPKLYTGLGEWYVRNNRNKEALEVLAYALKLNPKDINLERRLVELKK